MQNKTDNYFYKKEDRKDEPKDYFKLIATDILDSIDMSKKELLDIGCASGDFIYYLEQLLQKKGIRNTRLYGIDIYDELLEIAKSKNPKAKFIQKDIMDLGNINKKWDVVTLMGVTYLYEDIIGMIDNVLNVVDDQGILYIFERFNNYGFDISVKYKELRNNKDDIRREGIIHIHAIDKIKKYYEQLGWQISVIPFNIKVDIKQRDEDAYRTWTIDLANGKKGIISGLNIWNEYFALKFKKVETL